MSTIKLFNSDNTCVYPECKDDAEVSITYTPAGADHQVTAAVCKPHYTAIEQDPFLNSTEVGA